MKNTNEDYKKLVEHWNNVFRLTEEDREAGENAGNETWGDEELKEMTPSEKLFFAATSLGNCEKVLDYGCGNGWAGLIAARSGCEAVICADPAENALEAVKLYARMFGVEDRIKTVCIDETWIGNVEDEAYDGLICSNVLDVIPEDMAEDIMKNAARILKKGGRVVIGMNNYLDPASAKKRGLDLKNGNRLYVDGVLRLVSRSDEEWSEILGKYFTVERLEHFSWPGETKEGRRLFYLTK
jgi:SAM-dependent methyltransferase